MVKRILFVFIAVLVYSKIPAQTSFNSITEKEVKRILSFLTADSLQGRGNYTRQLHTAADFIKNEFQQLKLDYFGSSSTYYQYFTSIPKKSLGKIETEKDTADKILVNVIGVLPGISLANEAIIFSAHFDHVRPSGNRIFNGANDNASGTTALLMLAKHYALLNNNERTLIFCAFSGEELGLLGSNAFVNLIHPPAIKAVVNLEMLGRTNVVSKKEFFLTGSRESDLFKIFEKNLMSSPYKIVPDKNEEKKLFLRSDNYPFYLKKIPAHTIMCSDDDDECYHQPCDDFETIDTSNMVDVLKGIITASSTLVSGEDTPVLRGSRNGKKKK